MCERENVCVCVCCARNKDKIKKFGRKKSKDSLIVRRYVINADLKSKNRNDWETRLMNERALAGNEQSRPTREEKDQGKMKKMSAVKEFDAVVNTAQ